MSINSAQDKPAMPEADTANYHVCLPLDNRCGKYVIFRLARREFGTAVHNILEVMEMLEITPIPRSPAFIAGVINLRGKVIPVIDLRHIFELSIESPTARSGIVVVRNAPGSEDQTLGIVVDAVLEILDIVSEDFLELDELHGLADFERWHSAPYLTGVIRAGGTLKLLVDMEQVLAHPGLRCGEALPIAA